MNTTMSSDQRTGPGPKGGQADVRGALLAAGFDLYEERGFDLISLRDVAERAGVNQAMVRYYFKDKHGFLAAMLDDGVDRLLGAVPPGLSFRDVVESMISALGAMPWLPVLMMQTVYVSSDLRAHFIREHAPRMVALLGGAMRPRQGLDPSYAALSVISMLVFPQLARPVVGPVFGIQFDDRFSQRYADHVAGLFQSEGAPHG